MAYIVLKSDELAHARVYSHKYIRREPDGKGGYKYYYKTDLNVRPVNGSGTITATSYSDGGRRPVSKFRQADKASQIYREGQKQQYRDRLDTQLKKPRETCRANTDGRNYAALMQEKSRQDKANKKNSVGNYAKQAVSAISTAAGSVYDAGKKWLANLFNVK